MITIEVNGAVHRIAADGTVAALLAELAVPSRGVAVAVNGEIVRRADWPGHGLSAGDRVEVLTAAQGG